MPWTLRLFVRVSGVCLAIAMILQSPFAMWRFDHPPEATRFITGAPVAFYLFGWFLLPFSVLKPKAIWWFCFIGLSLACAVLLVCYASILAAHVRSRDTASFFLDGICAAVAIAQPAAVGWSRYLGFRSKEPNKALEPTTMAVTSPAAQEPRHP